MRNEYHSQLCQHLIRIRNDSQKGAFPNNAEGNSKISVKIAWVIVKQLCKNPENGSISDQMAEKGFQQITQDFTASAFKMLPHIRPGKWIYSTNAAISTFEQYSDLDEIEKLLELSKSSYDLRHR